MSQDRGPRCPDPSSAKSRLSTCFSKTVRDIPKFRPLNPEWVSAISRFSPAPFQTKSRTNSEKPRDIADISLKRVVTSRTRDLPKLVRSRTPRIGSGYRGQSAKLVTSRTKAPRTSPRGTLQHSGPSQSRGRPNESRGRPVGASGSRPGYPRPTQASATTRHQGCAVQDHPGKRRSKLRRPTARQRSREGQGPARRRDIADFSRRERGAA